MALPGVSGNIAEELPWLPDETLFSWCCRFHAMSANGNSAATCMQLFGSRTFGLAHDLPSQLDAFVQRTAGNLGTANELIEQRTLLPFYLPFKVPAVAERALACMRGAGIGHLKYALGLLTSGVGAAHPLKACASCMEEDRRGHGVAYWHRDHQWPATWVCSRHGEWLLVSPLKTNQRSRFEWLLPGRAALVAGLAGLGGALNPPPALFSRLTLFASQLTQEPAGRLSDASALSRVFRHRLGELDWTHASGRVRWRDLDEPIRSLISDLRRSLFFPIQLDCVSAKEQLARVLAGRSSGHPLRYLLWHAWLFDSWPVVLAGSRPASVQRPANLSTPRPEPDERMLIAVAAMRAGAESLTAIARRLHVDPSTVATWAARAGFESPRRAKSLKPALRDQVISMLRSGEEKSRISAQCGVSTSTVTRVLRTTPALQQGWHRARDQRRQEFARSAWLALMRSGDVLGIAAMRRLEPAAYAWLYRNDHEWLMDQCNSVGRLPSGGNHASVRLSRADRRYATWLQEAVLRSAHRTAPSSLALENLCRIAPALRRVLASPARWPLTLGVLRKLALARRPFGTAAETGSGRRELDLQRELSVAAQGLT